MDEKYKFIMYLDMDGVLMSEKYIIYIHDTFIKDKKERNETEFYYRNFMHKYCFQKEAVDFFNKLYEKFPYCIILTSTRRFEFLPKEWNLIFSINNVKAYVGGRTASFSKDKSKFTWREDEIEQYHFSGSKSFSFRKLPFLIIDDDSYDLQRYKDKLINVKGETGLTLDYYNEALEKLKLQGVE